MTTHVYCLPTGPASRYNFTIHDAALIRAPSRSELAPLQARIRVTQRGIFGADAFELTTQRGVLSACKIAPDCGPVRGWGRWPGSDHWQIDRDGALVFRTQNYCAVLRYFLAVLRADNAR